MIVTFNSETGSTTLLPERDEDNRLIFHLLNCNDLTKFSEYLARENTKQYPVTTDIGLPVEQFDDYPSRTEWETIPLSKNREQLQLGGKRQQPLRSSECLYRPVA